MKASYRLSLTLVLLLLGCNGSPDPVTLDNEGSDSSREVSFDDYGDIEICWAENGAINGEQTSFEFVGALALYSSNMEVDLREQSEPISAVVYSSRCHLISRTLDGGVDPSVEFGVNSISLAQGFDLSAAPPDLISVVNTDLATEIPAGIGANPEFPVRLYAVAGTVFYSTSKYESSRNFDELQIDRIQQLPREMFGSFVGYLEDRPLHVRLYLDPVWQYDLEGYRTGDEFAE